MTLEEKVRLPQNPRGNLTLKLHLEGNRVRIVYRPAIYFSGGFEGRAQMLLPLMLKGFQQWAGEYEVFGVPATVEVAVQHRIQPHVLGADIFVNSFKGACSRVPTASLWRPGIRQRMILNFGWDAFGHQRCAAHWQENVVNLTAHEFGHVLGLFDAYGYRQHWQKVGLGWAADVLLPAARPSLAAPDGIMRSPYHKPAVVTGREIEMMLTAWKTGRLQLYENCILRLVGAQKF